MDVEIFALCDFAQDMAGKLVAVGVFDIISAPKVPFQHALMAIAARMRFESTESGEHTFQVSMIDPERKDVVPPFIGDLNFQTLPGVDSGTGNLVFILSGVQFKLYGKHFIRLALDGEEFKKIPFYIKQQQQ